MASKDDFTPEEWTQLKAAPLSAAMYVVAASPSGPVGMVKEMLVLGTAAEALKQDAAAPQILKDLFAESEGEPKSEMKVELGDKDKVPAQRAALLAALKDGVALIDAKTGEDAAAIKAWILSTAEKVAGAAKEGGFVEGFALHNHPAARGFRRTVKFV
ncbi:MAG: hypothetical protein HGA45_43870 [Chloroflexales bacterium]|nr:hypothetical protein [Chloroflexales bacterium]